MFAWHRAQLNGPKIRSVAICWFRLYPTEQTAGILATVLVLINIYIFEVSNRACKAKSFRFTFLCFFLSYQLLYRQQSTFVFPLLYSIRTEKNVQCVLFIELCLAINVSSLDFLPKEADSLVGDETIEIPNRADNRSDSQLVSVIPLHGDTLNQTRQDRVQVFRPLFVYRQQEAKKRQQYENKNKNPDRNTVNKNPKPTTPSPIYPAVAAPFNPYLVYPYPPPPFYYPPYQPYQYPTYTSYSSSPYSSNNYFYSPKPSPTYLPRSYYSTWPTSTTGYYYDSKGYLSSGTTSDTWPTSSASSFYAPQTAEIIYSYPTAWQRK